MSEVPDYVAPLLGVRQWAVTRSLRLRSAYFPYSFVPSWRVGGEYVASCATHGTAAPEVRCGCGLYAHYDLLLSRKLGWISRNMVRGIVAASGDIVLHQRGFRAERMRLVALIFERRHNLRQRLRLVLLSWRYRVPLLTNECEFCEFWESYRGVKIDPERLPHEFEGEEERKEWRK